MDYFHTFDNILNKIEFIESLIKRIIAINNVEQMDATVILYNKLGNNIINLQNYITNYGAFLIPIDPTINITVDVSDLLKNEVAYISALYYNLAELATSFTKLQEQLTKFKKLLEQIVQNLNNLQKDIFYVSIR